MSKNNELVLKLVLTEKGLQLGTKHVAELGAAVEKTTKSKKEASKAADELNYKQNQGIIGNSSAARSFSKLSQAIGNGPNGLVGAYATLAANAFAVSAAFTKLREAAAAENVLKGLEAQGARTGKTLTLLSKQVKELTGNAISGAEAMRMTALTSSAGIGSQDVERITKVATNASKALGRNVEDSMNRLVMAITKIEPELVDELGLTIKITEASEMYARQLGKTADSLSQAQKQQALMNAWLEQGEIKFGSFANKVEANPFDKLAASFDDLIKSGLQFVNLVAGPIASLFAGNKIALLGTMVAFVGTLRGQLIPGLMEAAEHQKKLANLQKESLQDSFKGHTDVKGGKRKALNDYMHAAEEGIATQQQFTAALADMDAREESINKNSRMRAETKIRRLDEEGRRRKDLIALHHSQAKVQIATAMAAGFEASADANLFNAKDKIIGTLKGAAGAYSATRDATLLAANGAVTFGTRYAAMSKGVFAASKVVGAAMLNFLPVIGQIILVLGILKEVWDNVLKPESWKKREAAFAEYNEVLKSTQEKLKALNELENTAGNVAQKGQAILINKLNTVSELTAAYSKYANALDASYVEEQKKAEALVASKEQMERTMLRSSGLSGAVYAALMDGWDMWKGKIRKDNGVDLGSISDKLFDLGPTSSDRERAAAGSLAAINKILPNTTREWHKLNEEAGNFDDANKILSTTEEYLARVGKAAANTANLVEEYAKSVAQLKNDYADFINSIKPTTPYDKLVDSLGNVVTSANKARNALSFNTLNQEDRTKLVKELDAMSAALPRGILSESAKADIDAVTQLDNEIIKLNQDLTKIINNPEQYAAKQTIVNNKIQEQQNLLTKINSSGMESVRQYEALAHKAQIENITLQSTLALAQARLSVIQRQGVITAEDVDRRIKAENQIIQIQARMLQTQAEFLKLEVEQKRLDLEKIVNRKKELEDYAKLTQLRREQLALEQQGIINNLYTTEEQKEGARKFLELLTNQTALQKQMSDLEQDRIRAERELEVRAAGLEAVQSNIQAMLMGQTTEVEAQAQRAQAILKITQERWQVEREIKDLKASEATSARKIQDILSSGRTKFSNEIAEIKVAGELKLEIAQREGELKKKDLEISLALAKALGNEGQVKVYEDQLRLLNEKQSLTERQIQLETTIQYLEKVTHDTRVQGLQYQKDSIEVLQAYANQQNEVLSKEQELRRARLETMAARNGTKMGERAEKALEYQVLKEQLEAAKQQLALKKYGIELEYDLLEAKRLLLVEEMKGRREQLGLLSAQLRAQNKDSSEVDTMAKQLDTVIANISAKNYDALKTNAMRLADLEIEILRQRTEKARYDVMNVGRSDNPATKIVQDIRDAILVLSTVGKRTSPESTITELPPVVKSNNMLINVQTGLISAINLNTEALREKTSSSTQEAATSAATAAVSTVMGRLPLPDIGTRTSGYGMRMHPILGRRKQHTGIDFGAPTGTPVESTMAGRVVSAGWRGGYGNAVEIESLDGKVRTLYGHLSKITTVAGKLVSARELIGKVGSTGRSTGPHLHYEVRVNGKLVNPNQPVNVPIVVKNADDQASAANEEIVVTGAKVPKPSFMDEFLGTTLAPNFEDLMGPISLVAENVEDSNKRIRLSFEETLIVARTSIDGMITSIRELGPSGAAFAAMVEGTFALGQSISSVFQTVNTSYEDYKAKLIEDNGALIKTLVEDQGKTQQEAIDQIMATGMSKAQFHAQQISDVFSAAAAAIGAVMNILKASSDAKIAAVDREIAAEQKRDGKSSESVAKLDALEKKKDNMARKAFNTQKKLMLAQAVMSTAAGVAAALTAGPFIGPILAGITAAMGMAQIAIISGMQYESSYTPKSINTPSAVTIGKRGDSVDLAKGPNANAGGEVGYLRGAKGMGTNASNYNTVGSAYGGELNRGYGNRGFVVGEKGPEVINPETPITVTPNDEAKQQAPINATFSIQALDATGVKEVLLGQRGNIIQMLRDAANANGQRFLEDVNVDVYTRPNIGKL